MPWSSDVGVIRGRESASDLIITGGSVEGCNLDDGRSSKDASGAGGGTKEIIEAYGVRRRNSKFSALVRNLKL